MTVWMEMQENLAFCLQREARLISNLKRTLALLDLMGVKSTERDQVTRLLNGLEQTPWSENLANTEQFHQHIHLIPWNFNKPKEPNAYTNLKLLSLVLANYLHPHFLLNARS